MDKVRPSRGNSTSKAGVWLNCEDTQRRNPTVVPKMNAASSIVGTWKIPSLMIEGADEFMHVGADGRIVHFVYTDTSSKGFVPMMLWSEPLEEDWYKMRARPLSDAWSVRMFSTESGMKIVRSEKSFDLLPASESDLPDWYFPRLQDAFSRMDKREREATEAQQDAS